MRVLVAALASLAMVACGGLEPTSGPSCFREAALEVESTSPDSTVLEESALMPEGEQVWKVTWAHGGDALRLVQVPVEERFFYPVDVNVQPPELPTPPCPNCR